MDALHSFGFITLLLMLIFYALEDRSPWYILAFAATCLLSSVYGFMAGTWPFGIIEVIWTVVALDRFRRKRSLA